MTFEVGASLKRFFMLNGNAIQLGFAKYNSAFKALLKAHLIKGRNVVYFLKDLSALNHVGSFFFMAAASFCIISKAPYSRRICCVFAVICDERGFSETLLLKQECLGALGLSLLSPFVSSLGKKENGSVLFIHPVSLKPQSYFSVPFFGKMWEGD